MDLCLIVISPNFLQHATQPQWKKYDKYPIEVDPNQDDKATEIVSSKEIVRQFGKILPGLLFSQCSVLLLLFDPIFQGAL